MSETLFSAFWLIWLLPLFLAWELGALGLHRPDLTLSWHLWRWFSVKEFRRFWLSRRLVLLAFCLTLTAHIAGGLAVGPFVVAAALAVVVIAYSLLFEADLNRAAATRARQAGQPKRTHTRGKRR